MKNIAVIGAGTMGNGIAHVFAQNGYHVNLIDISEAALEKALLTIAYNLDRMVKKEKITNDIKENTLNHLNKVSNLEKGVQNADLVIEAATENIDTKLSLFKEIDKFAPENCILATNTSSISITKIASKTKRVDKMEINIEANINFKEQSTKKTNENEEVVFLEQKVKIYLTKL